MVVQERIEETNFYNEHNSATTLVDQLGYLLNCNNGGRIRASTPIHNSSTDVAVNTDHVCEIRATSLEDLPGNTETKEDAPLPNTHETDTEEGAAVAKNNGNTAAQDVEAAIKNIVQKATSDPFFDKVVKEVIGMKKKTLIMQFLKNNFYCVKQAMMLMVVRRGRTKLTLMEM